MVCPKCHGMLTEEDILPGGMVIQCPNCGAKYKRKENPSSEPISGQPKKTTEETSRTKSYHYDGKNCPVCGSLILGGTCPKCYFDPDYSDGGPKHLQWLKKQRELGKAREALKAASASLKKSDSRGSINPVASILKTSAWLIYIVACILGIILGNDIGDTIFSSSDFSVTTMLVIWAIGFVSGTVMMGFGEIISLLHEINEKQPKLSDNPSISNSED